MSNPTKAGLYTTIFKDGTIIHYNEWIVLENGKGKWYWDNTILGGVLYWFEPKEKYEFHNFFKLPDWELREILDSALKYEALNFYNLVDKQALDSYLIEEGFASYDDFVENELKTYYEGYREKGEY